MQQPISFMFSISKVVVEVSIEGVEEKSGNRVEKRIQRNDLLINFIAD